MSPARKPAGSPRAKSAGPATNIRLAGVFAALGDPTRLAIVSLLCAGSALSISQLTATTAISRQAVTKHLQVLADAGLVRDTWQGRERLWQLDPAQIAAARETLTQIGAQWDTALGKLKAFVEAGGTGD